MSTIKRRMEANASAQSIMDHLTGGYDAGDLEEFFDYFEEIHRQCIWIDDDDYMDIYKVHPKYIYFWTPLAATVMPSEAALAHNSKKLGNPLSYSAWGDSWSLPWSRINLPEDNEQIDRLLEVAGEMAQNMSDYLMIAPSNENALSDDGLESNEGNFKEFHVDRLLALGDGASEYTFAVSQSIKEIEGALCRLTGQNRIKELDGLRSVLVQMSEKLSAQSAAKDQVNLEQEVLLLRQRLNDLSEERDRLYQLLQESLPNKSTAFDHMKSGFFTTLGAAPAAAAIGFVAMVFNTTTAADLMSSLQVIYESALLEDNED